MTDMHDPLSTHAAPRAFDRIADARRGAARALRAKRLTRTQYETIMAALKALEEGQG